MSGEIEVFWNDSKLKTLESNGLAVTSAMMSAGTTDVYNVAVDGLNYPDAQFILKVTFASAAAEGGVIALCAQPLNLDGSDAEPPKTTRPEKMLGRFPVSNTVGTPQTLSLDVQDVPRNARYYLYNVNTGQAISAGWTLKVLPKTFRPAA